MGSKQYIVRHVRNPVKKNDWAEHDLNSGPKVKSANELRAIKKSSMIIFHLTFDAK